MPQARRFPELGVTSDAPLAQLEQIDLFPRKVGSQASAEPPTNGDVIADETAGGDITGGDVSARGENADRSGATGRSAAASPSEGPAASEIPDRGALPAGSVAPAGNAVATQRASSGRTKTNG